MTLWRDGGVTLWPAMTLWHDGGVTLVTVA